MINKLISNSGNVYVAMNVVCVCVPNRILDLLKFGKAINPYNLIILNFNKSNYLVLNDIFFITENYFVVTSNKCFTKTKTKFVNSMKMLLTLTKILVTREKKICG